MAVKGLSNFCIKDGYRMITHFTQTPMDMSKINGYAEAMAIYNAKWT
jgi:hypothetical protein